MCVYMCVCVCASVCVRVSRHHRVLVVSWPCWQAPLRIRDAVAIRHYTCTRAPAEEQVWYVMLPTPLLASRHMALRRLTRAEKCMFSASVAVFMIVPPPPRKLRSGSTWSGVQL